MAFFNKYPYTDFHELNADWIIKQVSDLKTQVKELEDRVEECETIVNGMDSRVTDLEGRATDLEGRMNTAEGDIDDLQAADVALDGRLDALEGADIQDAAMLSSVGPADPSALNVEIPFVRDTYADGVKTAGTQSTTIPAATSSLAGVMLPGEKVKLNAFTVDGSGNATFTGTVTGAAPEAAANYATKEYVDNIVIAGQASVVYDSAADDGSWYSSNVTPDEYSDGVTAYQWGAVTEIHVSKGFTFTTDNIDSGSQEITHIPLKSGYIPSSGFRRQVVLARRIRNSNIDYVPVLLLVNPTNQNHWLQVMNLRGVAWLTGDKMELDYTKITYLM